MNISTRKNKTKKIELDKYCSVHELDSRHSSIIDPMMKVVAAEETVRRKKAVNDHPVLKAMAADIDKKIRKHYEEKGPRLVTSSTGVKHDTGKLEWALLPWREVKQVVKVLTLGAKKYSPDNWQHVPAAERRYFDAAMRHISARQLGEIKDPETKMPHLAHAVCCLLFWLWFDNNKRRGHK